LGGRKKSPYISLIHGGLSAPFIEDFSSPVLDPAWTVYQWLGPNVYEYETFGRYSLTAHPGHLRIFLDSMMDPNCGRVHMPSFSGWYWYYPSLEIGLILAGDRWELETKRMFLTGECWFVPAGAYADWDYFRFRPLGPDE